MIEPDPRGLPQEFNGVTFSYDAAPLGDFRDIEENPWFSRAAVRSYAEYSLERLGLYTWDG